MSQSEKQDTQKLDYKDAAEFLLEECRMVLPGIQALFGFQLICVFSPGFSEKLSHIQQILHYGAIFLVATAAALVMTPAAYHRQIDPLKIREDFFSVSTKALLCSMFPLGLGITVDFYLIGRVILQSFWSAIWAALLFGAIFFLWFVLPRLKSH